MCTSDYHTRQGEQGRSRKSKKDCLRWDGLTKVNWCKITMNKVMPTENEADITFGYVYMTFFIWIYNLRILFPDEEILLAFINVSSCFRWPRIFPCLVGAFSFMIGTIFYATNAMVFGFLAPETSWDPFRRATAAIAMSYFGNRYLVSKHKKWLDTVR